MKKTCLIFQSGPINNMSGNNFQGGVQLQSVGNYGLKINLTSIQFTVSVTKNMKQNQSGLSRIFLQN